MKRAFTNKVIGAALAALVISFTWGMWTWAQTIGNQVSGNECWNAGQGPGGPSTGFMCTFLVRNSTGFQLFAALSGANTPSNTVNQMLVNAQPANGTTINTPLNPFDGELFSVCNVSNAAWATNTVTLAASTGSSLNTGVTTALTTLAARTCVELQYVASTTTWYQVR